MTKVRGDSVPIKKYKTKKETKYMPYTSGPAPKAKKLQKSFNEGYG